NGTFEHYDRLVEVRPDLPKIELDCQNTLTAIPYADLVMEILEEIIVSGGTAGVPTGTDGESPALLAYPQHIDRPGAVGAYLPDPAHVGRSLAERQYPRTLPYLLPLDELRTYLAHTGVPHDTLIESFNDLLATPLSGAVRGALAMGAAPAAVASFPSDFTANPNTYWGGGPTTDLDDLPTLFTRAQLDDFDMLLDLLRTRYLNGESRVGIYLKDASQLGGQGQNGQFVDPCRIDNLRVAHDTGAGDPNVPPEEGDLVAPTNWFWSRMAAFLRLMHWTRLSPLHLDKALFALDVAPSTPGTNANYSVGIDVDGPEIQALHGFVRLLEHTQLHPPEVFSWWREMDQYEDRANRPGGPEISQYERVFLDPSVMGDAVNSVFAVDGAGELVTSDANTNPAQAHATLLAAALRISEEDLVALDAFITATVGVPGLNVIGLWTFYRWASFARAARLPIVDLESFVRMVWVTSSGPSDGFPETPQAAYDDLVALDKMRSHGLEVGPLAWVFGHVNADLHGMPAATCET
ncbi:MAG: hypothetical protein AAF211_33190, partial [Myxococcota bacterium]